jgi:hypothetical protein
MDVIGSLFMLVAAMLISRLKSEHQMLRNCGERTGADNHVIP